MKFGTDGIRGRAGEAPIDADGARRVGAAAALWVAELGGGSVVVARDTRPSGPLLAEQVALAASAAGARAVDVGVLPTSGLQAILAEHALEGRVAVGVVVTASHNPASDNGFKVLGPWGRKLDDAQTSRIEASLEAAPAEGAAEVVDGRETALDTYARALADALGDIGSLRGRRIAVDLARGAATAVIDELAELLWGVEIVWTGIDEGAVNDRVGSEHPEHLADVVRQHRCDAGLAVDGDADRALLVDAAGEVVPGDALLWLLARDLDARELVVTVMSSGALEASLPGVRIVRTPVGDRHVALAMRDADAPVGGEESGHVLFARGLPGGDGVLTGIRALAAAFRQAGAITEALAPFPRWPRRLTKVAANTRVPVESTPALVDAARAGEAALGAGRVFLRWSGTEPVLRILVEGHDAATVERVSADVTDACRRALA